MSYIAINGAIVKSPQKLRIGIHTVDADSSGRNANGRMVRDVIAEKVKLECEWGPLSDSEVSGILQRIRSEFFSVTYPDPTAGTVRTKTFYCGDRSTPVYSFSPKFAAAKWSGLSVNFIEQ